MYIYIQTYMTLWRQQEEQRSKGETLQRNKLGVN